MTDKTRVGQDKQLELECAGMASFRRRGLTGIGFALGVCAMILLSGCQTSSMSEHSNATTFNQIETSAGDPTALAAYSQKSMMAPRYAARGFRVENPQSLLRLTRGDVASALGAPAFRRTEPPAEVWQYKADNCVLDIFFYKAGADRHPDDSEVAYFEMRRPVKLQIGSLDDKVEDVAMLTRPDHQADCLKSVLSSPDQHYIQRRADKGALIPGGVI